MAAGGAVTSLLAMSWQWLSEIIANIPSAAELSGYSERTIYISAIIALFLSLGYILRWIAKTWLLEQQEMHRVCTATIAKVNESLIENRQATDRLTDSLDRQNEWFEGYAKNALNFMPRPKHPDHL